MNGRNLGITSEERINLNGIHYISVKYPKNAQAFLIDNLYAIVEYKNSDYIK